MTPSKHTSQKKTILISANQKIKRLDYCRKWLKLIKLENVTFVDEKPLELFKIPNAQNTRYYRKKSEKNTIPVYAQTKHPTILHTFACVNWWGKSDIRFYIDNI